MKKNKKFNTDKYTSLAQEKMFLELSKLKTEIKNLDKLPNLDSAYLSFLSKYTGQEMTPDIIIFIFKESLKENKYSISN
ncbi:MAG: hypothetical protein QM726_23145 [Chitinophagaceae bacterium]